MGPAVVLLLTVLTTARSLSISKRHHLKYIQDPWKMTVDVNHHFDCILCFLVSNKTLKKETMEKNFLKEWQLAIKSGKLVVVIWFVVSTLQMVYQLLNTIILL